MTDTPRAGCAFHGALCTLSGIPGVVPVAHATANCAANCALSRVSAVASTNLLEKSVIFGGASRLREQLKNTVQMQEGDLYAVITGCVPEIVGDDAESMTKEAAEQGYPAVCVNAPGFSGGMGFGYERAVIALLRYFSKARENGGEDVEKAGNASSGYDVNIFGIVPHKHIFWLGEICALRDFFGLLGLRANVLIGPDAGAGDWRAALQARFSVAFSQHGLPAAQFLEERHGIPYLLLTSLPVGVNGCRDLARRVGQELAVKVPDSAFEQMKNAQDRFHYALAEAAQLYYSRGLQRTFAVVAGHDEILGCARFLIDTFGMIPSALAVTDVPQLSLCQPFLSEIEDLAAAFGARLLISEDAGEISRMLSGTGPGLILGSGLEAGPARGIGVPFVEISAPSASAPAAFYRSYCGISGGETLASDIFRAVLG
jgi:nitrogenase molybdenum-iron protein beta chain